MNKTIITFRDKDLALYDNGNYGKVPVVFVHGNSMSSNIWIKQFESTLSDSHHLVALDLPGCGSSGHSQQPQHDYQLLHMGDAILSVIDHLKLQSYFLVGHSLGGNVIFQRMNKFTGCRGVLTIGTPPVSIPPELGNMFLPNPNIGALFQENNTEEAIDALISDFFLTREIPVFVKADHRATDTLLRKTIADAVSKGDFLDEIAMLKDCGIPVAFICGKEEKVINNAYFNALTFSSLWRNEAILIERSAHCPQWENAEVFNELLTAFILNAG